MEVREKRIYNGDVGGAAQCDPTRRFVLRRAVDPNAVEYEMIDRPTVLRKYQIVNHLAGRTPRDLKSEESYVIGARGQQDRFARGSGIDNLRHHIFGGGTRETRPARQ